MLGEHVTPEQIRDLRPRSGSTSRCSPNTCFPGHAVRGDFGMSIRAQRPRSWSCWSGCRPRSYLAAGAFLFALCVGTPIGVISAVKRLTLWVTPPSRWPPWRSPCPSSGSASCHRRLRSIFAGSPSRAGAARSTWCCPRSPRDVSDRLIIRLSAERARRPGPGLRAHRASQGPGRAVCDRAPRAAQRATPSSHCWDSSSAAWAAPSSRRVSPRRGGHRDGHGHPPAPLPGRAVRVFVSAVLVVSHQLGVDTLYNVLDRASASRSSA